MKRFLPVFALCFALGGVAARAADEEKDKDKDSEKSESSESATTTLDQFKLGETVANDAVTPESLKGKVVVLEMWGIR